MNSQNKNTVLDENSPVISADVRLGEKYDSVEFDYDAYRREAERVGLPPEAQNQTIAITKSSAIGPTGAYYSGNVKVAAREGANSTLAHELQHASDDKAGKLGEMPTSYKIGVLAAMALTPLSMTGMAGTIGNIYGNELAEKYMSLPYPIVTLGVGSAAVLGYFANPMEVRARKAARENSENVISLTEKPKTWYQRLKNRYTLMVVAGTLGGLTVTAPSVNSPSRTPAIQYSVDVDSVSPDEYNQEQFTYYDEDTGMPVDVEAGPPKDGTQTPGPPPPEVAPGKNPTPEK